MPATGVQRDSEGAASGGGGWEGGEMASSSRQSWGLHLEHPEIFMVEGQGSSLLNVLSHSESGWVKYRVSSVYSLT